jgi:hypothetical protein
MQTAIDAATTTDEIKAAMPWTKSNSQPTW